MVLRERKGLIGILAMFSLLASAYFSLRSFTGYVVSETINGTTNLLAFAFFLVGILLAYWFIKSGK